MDDQERIAVAVLSTHVKRIDITLSEIKADLHRLDTKMDAGFNVSRQETVRVDAKIDARFDETRKELQKLDAKMDAGFAECRQETRRLDAKVDDVDKRLSEKIDDVDKRLSDKIDSRFFWTLGALGGVVAAIVGFIYFFFGKLVL